MACASRVGGAKRDDKETARDDFVVSPAGWLQAAVELEDTGIHKYVYIYIYMYIHIHTVTRRPWRCTFQDFAKNSLGVVKLSKKRHAFFP